MFNLWLARIFTVVAAIMLFSAESKSAEWYYYGTALQIWVCTAMILQTALETKS